MSFTTRGDDCINRLFQSNQNFGKFQPEVKWQGAFRFAFWGGPRVLQKLWWPAKLAVSLTLAHRPVSENIYRYIHFLGSARQGKRFSPATWNFSPSSLNFWENPVVQMEINRATLSGLLRCYSWVVSQRCVVLGRGIQNTWKGLFKSPDSIKSENVMCTLHQVVSAGPSGSTR